MKHGLYFRLHPWNDECIVEMQSVCTQKNIKCATTRFCYIRDKVIKYFMKKIATFVEKYYVSKIREEDQKPFVRYNYSCGICFETRTTFNVCSVCKFSMCLVCIKQLKTPHCAYCRTPNMILDVSYRDTQRLFTEMFGDRLNFTVCIDLFDMVFDVISENSYIVLKEEYDCYCYADMIEPKTPDYYLIRQNKRTGVITNGDILEQLFMQGYERDIDTCAHRYFEGCKNTNINTDNEFEICWGS